MPKIVDHEKRRKQIAEATWRVILNLGMEGATVRNIAKEAGLSLGALRHYFSTQDELLVYAMDLVKEQATVRINEITRKDLPPKEMILSILLQMVPINEETMAEMEVWIAFIAHARHREDIFNIKDDGVFNGIKKLVDSMDQYGLLRKELDIAVETERLYALIDGIALHALLEPKRVDKERIVRVLEHHLDTICIE
ncbi:TetR/AcrR family transcriptional regulator [Cytobacillus solani]|uniref:TetR family transcriptional regulator n=1 Tax=Cytobacillus solani TaxID=1637975 RepID=A0A0Q3QIS4_9BACI|nr:TetR/AcrR family transcriptional regulator [Cytobacillus solani]KOP77679.1 TetR family transcriptional regulator [Bacillus sp. FJAT-21945]KQL17526.1 TetR family transcriptional regulator [Cytobacillus solani]USK55384.1 TetR/AcrR family transcriptional regulator [Cytobacillus solani]